MQSACHTELRPRLCGTLGCDWRGRGGLETTTSPPVVRRNGDQQSQQSQQHGKRMQGHCFGESTVLGGRFVGAVLVWFCSGRIPRSNNSQDPSFNWAFCGDVLQQHLVPVPTAQNGTGSPPLPSLVHLWQARCTLWWYKQRNVRSLLWKALAVRNTFEFESQ